MGQCLRKPKDRGESGPQQQPVPGRATADPPALRVEQAIKRQQEPANQQQRARRQSVDLQRGLGVQRDPVSRRQAESHRVPAPQRVPSPRRDGEQQWSTQTGMLNAAVRRDVTNLARYPTKTNMTEQVRSEVLRTLHFGFQDLSYAIIGRAALIEYDPDQSTSDVDVIVSSRLREAAVVQLLQSDDRIVRLGGGDLA